MVINFLYGAIYLKGFFAVRIVTVYTHTLISSL